MADKKKSEDARCLGEGMSLKEIDKVITQRKRQIAADSQKVESLKADIRVTRKFLKLWEKARELKVSEMNKMGDNK